METVTKPDGTKVETTTGKDGSVTKTETKKDGSSVTENKAADGSTGTVKTDKNGQTEAKTALSNKAIEDAKKNLIRVSLKGTTIPHEIIGEFGAGRVLMRPAAPGTGVIAGGPVRAVLEAAGIKDIRTKCLRSNNPQNVVKATMQGLESLRGPEQVAAIRGKSVEEIVG